ncbi:peptidoglycan DD-metalloendopeptidase family protein [Telluribacter sp.]|jgi:murein DD-endopeptidase MepM/ murein hydrolase activator NlpD|uniref:peptidoglycan DD-metalloendopeptidase family protein n=1 Tax=Telluribacter sp. TaxID=1978767 RepID=UPI002E0FBAC5|nr:peptidoglycan DD-metalloendopeptidase family protein [Telluribacter sp.]
MTRRLNLIAAVISLVILTAAQSLVFDFSKSIFVTDPAPDSSAIGQRVPAPIQSAPVVFGIPTDSLLVKEGVVKRGETISTILGANNIGPATIHELTQKAKGVYNLKNIRTQRSYTLLYATDSTQTARYFIYEPNELEYVVYDLRNELNVTLHKREVEIVQRELVGEIKGSLYQSILKAGGSAQLVNKLADIYAWRLNLNHIQVGDTFKLIFEEKQVNGKTIEEGQLFAAFIEHNGQPLYAIGFDQGNGISYYDQDGKSFKKAFLKEPVEYSRISSRFTKNRFHPVQKINKPHLGTDFAAPTGTPIRSVGDGVVLEAAFTSGNGYYVKIKHNKTYTTQYLHMSKFAKGIRRGSRVAMGQTIGYVGSTGLSTGPHLCYRFWKNGVQVDALKEKLPLAEPVSKLHRMAFLATKESLMGRMEAMDARLMKQDMLAAKQSAADNSSI